MPNKPSIKNKRNPIATAILLIIGTALAALALMGAAVVAGLIKAFILPGSYTPLKDLTLPTGLLLATATIATFYITPALIARLSEKAREKKVWQKPRTRPKNEEKALEGTKPASDMTTEDEKTKHYNKE